MKMAKRSAVTLTVGIINVSIVFYELATTFPSYKNNGMVQPFYTLFFFLQNILSVL